MKINLVVLATEKQVYDHFQVSTKTKDEYDTRFFNENNHERAMGLEVESVTFIGHVEKPNIAFFSSLIKE